MIAETRQLSIPEPDQPAGQQRRLTGKELLVRGLITEQQLEDALAHQAAQGGRIGEILFGMTRQECTAIGEIVAAGLGLGWTRPDAVEIPAQVLELVPARIAIHYGVIPIALAGDAIRLATAEPQNLERLDEIELLAGRPIIPVFALTAHIQEAIKKLYGVGADTIEKMQQAGGGDLVIEDEDQHSIDEDSGEASIIRFVNQIISEAHRLSATDIHFEPGEDSFRIRYRIDGLLEDIPIPPHLKKFQATIISRLKVMARLDIAEQRLPQDGRIQVKIAGESFDLRVSVLPTPVGEAIDLRLLRRSRIHLGLSELGYTDDALVLLEEAGREPNGIILVTGPTGSGKTTTLYALLSRINTAERKIITIEDPIEYHLPGMIQMQVHEEIGFTFARALRSILRHDPDIILVGEIRDSETSEIAIRMAMTGHLVLSTLHTNDASSTIARLIDMGQEPFLLASSILCVVAQRLIRRLCPHCLEPYSPEPAALTPLKALGRALPQHLYRGRGCERCRRSGFLGRTVIDEIFPIDENFRELIMQRSPASKFLELARRKGIKTLNENGWERVLAHQTTIEEVLRITKAMET